MYIVVLLLLCFLVLPFVLILSLILGTRALVEQLAETPGWFRQITGTAVPRGQIIAKGIAVGDIFCLTWVMLIRNSYTVDGFFASPWFYGVIAAGAALSCGILCWRKPDRWFWSFLMALALSAVMCVCLVLFDSTRAFLLGGNALGSLDGEKLAHVYLPDAEIIQRDTHLLDGVKEAWALWGVYLGIAAGLFLTVALVFLIRHILDARAQNSGVCPPPADTGAAVSGRIVLRGLVTGTIFVFFWLLSHLFNGNYFNMGGESYIAGYFIVPLISVVCCTAALSRNGTAKWGLSLILAILCYLICSTIYACAIVALYAPLIPKLQLTDVFRFIYIDILFFLLQFIEIAVLVLLCRRSHNEKTALAG